MTRLVSILVASVFFLGIPAANAAERHALLAQCTKMKLFVFLSAKSEGDLKLEKDAVVNAVESRLRAARLFEKGVSTQFLVVTVLGVGPAFHVDVSLERWLPDTGFGNSGVVTVWKTGTVGTSNSGQFILGAVTENLDEFLAKYLRANEEACAKK